MRVLPVWLGRAVATACALALAYAWWSERQGPFLALPESWAAPLAGLAVLALCGRVLLAWLPPGHIGGHGPSQLAETWAASHLLGTLACALLSPVAPELRSAGASWPELAVACAFVLAAALRLVTLPAAMVPRHASAHERPGRLVRALGRGAWVLVLAVALSIASGARAPSAPGLLASLLSLPFPGLRAGPGWPHWLAAAHYLALAVVLRHAMRASRLAPAGALCAWSLCLLAPACARASTDELTLALGITSGAGFAVGWLRKAARRSLVLSLVGWSLALAADGMVVAVAGIAATLFAGARASRPLYARGALACMAASVVVSWSIVARLSSTEMQRLLESAPSSQGSPSVLQSFGLAHAAALVALALAWLPALPRRVPLETRDGLRIDPPLEAARVSAAVVAAAYLTLAAAAVAPSRFEALHQAARSPLLLMVLPAAGLLVAAVFVRSEAPGGRVSE